MRQPCFRKNVYLCIRKEFDARLALSQYGRGGASKG